MSDLQPWEARAVLRALPPDATPTAATWHVVPGRAIEMSPDDVVALTETLLRDRLPAGGRLVMSLRAEDLDPDSEANIRELVAATNGGVLVVAVGYEVPGVHGLQHECPECGSHRAQFLGPADAHVPEEARGSTGLFQCRDCGTAWDAPLGSGSHGHAH